MCFQGSTLDVAKRKSTLGPVCLPHVGFCSSRTGCCNNNHTQQSRTIAVNDGRVFRLVVDMTSHDFCWATLGLVQRPVFAQVGCRAACQASKTWNLRFPSQTVLCEAFLALPSLADVCWCTATLMPISEACLELCTHHTRPLLISVRSAP